MPFTVKCPICNLDGTARANEMLAQQFTQPPKQAHAAPLAGTIVPTGFAPPPVGYTPPPSPPPPAISAPPRTVSAAPPPPSKPVPAPAPKRQSTPAPTASPASALPKSKTKVAGQFNLALGIVGGVIGALAGCGLLYAVWYWTRIPYLPIGVVAGVLAGYGARRLARGTASTLGIATAGITGGAVAGTLFYMGGIVPLSAVSIAFGAGVAFMMSSNLMVTPAQKKA